MNLEMDNRSAERMIHTAQKDREVKSWKKDGVWGDTVAWLQSTYYSNKSEAFVANMAKGAIATLKREHPNLSDDLLALNIRTFVDNKDRILSDFPGGYSESKWSDSEGKPISEKEAFDGLALKDKLKMAMWGGQEYRDIQEARQQLEAKNKLAEAARDTSLGTIARAISTLKAVPEKANNWLQTAWKKLTKPEHRRDLAIDVVLGVTAIALIYGLAMSQGSEKKGYSDEVAIAPVAVVVRQMEKTAEAPLLVSREVIPVAMTAQSSGRVEISNVIDVKEWSVSESGFDLSSPFTMTIPAETLAAVGLEGNDAHVGLNPALEDQPTFRQDIADRFAQYGVEGNRNLADVVRTHADGLYAMGFHSGNDRHGAMPGEFLDVENPETLVGQTIKLIRDGKEVILKFTAVKRVDADLVGAGGTAVGNATSTVSSAHIRLDALGFTEDEYRSADLVLFTCGKDGSGTFGERVFALLEVVSDDEGVIAAVMPEPAATAVFYDFEHADNVETNMAIAAAKVNEWFANNSLTIGQKFSFNRATDYFRGPEWKTTDRAGVGACDIATLMYRAIKDYAEKNGIEPVRLPNWNGHEVWQYGKFVVTKYDHSDYEGKPDDEIAVYALDPEDENSVSNTNFFIEITDPYSEVTFGIVEKDGNFHAFLEENNLIAARNN